MRAFSMLIFFSRSYVAQLFFKITKFVSRQDLEFWGTGRQFSFTLIDICSNEQRARETLHRLTVKHAKMLAEFHENLSKFQIP